MLLPACLRRMLDLLALSAPPAERRRNRGSDLAVTAPELNTGAGVVFVEFRLAGTAEVLEQLGLLLQTDPLDDPKQLVPNVDGEERRLRPEWKSRREVAMMLD